MTAETPTQLKARFENGDVPTATDFENLIDSSLNVLTTDDQTVLSNTLTMVNIECSTLLADTITATRGVTPHHIVLPVKTGITATGTTEASAAVVTAGYSTVTISTAGVNEAVTVGPIGDLWGVGTSYVIKNLAATAIQVFPGSGNFFDTLATNAAFSVAANKAVTFIRVTNKQWITV